MASLAPTALPPAPDPVISQKTGAVVMAPKPARPAVPILANATPTEPRRTLPPETVSLLVRRGNDMLSIGDVSAARLLFGRAAEAGSPDAMVGMGRTYDPTVLAQTSPLLPSDPAEAANWYRRAAGAGNTVADDLLARLETQRAR